MKNNVLIVGGGMVGAAAAVELARQGCQVTVIENNPIDARAVLEGEQVDIRVSAINRFSEALLDKLGAMDLIRLSRNAPYHQLEAYEQGSEHLLFDREEVSTSHLGHLVENSIIQAALWSQFEENNIQVVEVKDAPIAVEQHLSSIELVYPEQRFTADLLIAADGGRSQLRHLAGIGVTGWQYQQHCMGILIKLDAPQQVKTWQEFKPTGPIAFLPMQAPYANLIWYHHSSELKRLQTLSNEALKEEVLSQFFDLPGDFTIEQRAVFPLARQHANQYSKGRLVLVGDAAHTINPLAGQGVNLGFKDVAALGGCLQGGDDVGELSQLHQYEKMRRKDNLLMMSMMDACYFGFSNELKPLKSLRSLALTLANKAGPLKREVLKHAMGGSF
ncbi:tungsten formylmethanofuran dehydrogenase [Pseudoalteromonas luteoviolacea]|uniref:Tungsten formylmethanofuran dehydrogenase n=1 Tax=Pseudoalteromonas luteoviolacea TaxID=43657 RepID=A0A1C0TJ34_9GAMM|nr:FAD-dependent oxidoreductase [Pseudoalteromonas luteoviolacea]OCQ18217.1 tungsten formylmethanofuran dehydrogenase [Pseudoalteromonas luteoviolacea]